MNEMFHIISRSTDGINEGIAIGGDVFPGSTLLEHILRFEANPEIKMIVSLGELGGKAEYDIAEAKKWMFVIRLRIIIPEEISQW